MNKIPARPYNVKDNFVLLKKNTWNGFRKLDSIVMLDQ